MPETATATKKKKAEPELPEVEKAVDEGRFDLEFPYVDLAVMNPAPYNPRDISDEALDALKHSLESYGLVQPLVWNKRTGNLVGGHQRHKLLLREGVKQAKTCIVDLDEIEEQALNLSLNNPALQGEFNSKMLKSVLENLKKKKTKKEFKEAGLDVLENQLPLFDEEVRRATRKEPTEIKEDPADLSYIAPALRGLAVPINSLKGDKGNVRTHSDRNRLAVRDSLGKFGQLRPIVAYKGVVMAGNCTWEEMKSLGRTHVAVVKIDHLTPAEMVAFGIMDNKSAELAGTDFKKLAETFRGMEDVMLPFTGYMPHEVSPLLEAVWTPPASTEGAEGDAINSPSVPTHHTFNLPIEESELLRKTIAMTGKNLAEGVKEICEYFVTNHPTLQSAPTGEPEAGEDDAATVDES